MQYRKTGLAMAMLCLVASVLVGSFVFAPPAQAANDRPLIYGQNPIETDIYWGYDKYTNDPTEFDRMSSSGTTSCRIGVNWPVIESTRGTRVWTDIDRLVKLAIDRNVNPILLINGTPTWALPTVNPDIPVPEARYPCNMTYLADYNSFITELANRYKGRVQFYEYWNEANGYGWHWDGGYSRADEYTPWMIRAYNLLKAADPNCKMSTSGFDDNGGNADYMLQQMYTYGAHGYFDAVADHPYSATTLDDYKLTDIRNLLNANGDSAADIWITEMGWTAAGREATVAGWITDYFNRLVNTHTTVKIATYHTAMDFDTTSRYGLIDEYFNTKATWTAFSNYTKPARPTISGISVSNITSSGATVNYTTNVTTKSLVMYGTADTYGSVTVKEATAVTSHAIPLSGLSASTTYHYRIRVSNPTYGVYGDSYSADLTFTTSAAGGTGSITGYVKDLTNVAISGATVSTNTGGYTTTTAADGTYTLSNVTAGTYNVTASKTNYVSKTNNGVVVTSGNATTSNFNLQNSMNTNTPTGTNNAPQSTTVTADTVYGVGWEGTKAVDGVNTSASKWVTTGAVPPHWLALDLGQNRTVNGFVLKMPGQAGEASYYNAKNFSFQSATSMAGPWSDEVVIDNTAQANSVARSYVVPRTLRYVRLYITNAGIDNYSRINEFEVWCSSCSVPTITTQPTSSTICSGGTASFSVTATNATGYQWRKAAANISGATSSAYSKSGATTADAGSYDCVVSNACGNVTSSAATLTVNSVPAITTQPVSQTKTVGQSVTFSVTATGATSYQWKKAAVNISGATQSSYTIGSVVTGDAGSYTVAVTNSCGTVTSNAATLTVNTGGPIASEDFTTLPTWSSTFDATWGSAATFSSVTGGQTGNQMQASRASQGSSAKVKVYAVPTNTNITISVYLKAASYGGGAYWTETSYKFGSNTASDFDGNAATWTPIKNFSNTGTNGNGNVWTQYTATVNTGANTQISIGYKHGASGCVGPTMGWDTFAIN